MGARMIRDDLLESERVQKRSVPARWLYVTILLIADDVGLFEVSTFKLHRAAALDEKIISKLLDELATVDLVRLYEAGGKRYGFVPRFGQRLRIKRATHPLPPDAVMEGDDKAASKINELAGKVLTGGGGAPHGADSLPQGAGARRPEVELEEEEKKAPSLRSVAAGTPVGDAPPAKKRAKSNRGKDAVPPSAATWEAYSAAYQRRYGVEPVRNASVNGQLANFVARIPADEAPSVAAFYLSHKGGLYTSAKHPVNLLLRDAEKLRTDWATNQRTDASRFESSAETAHHRQMRETHAALSGGRVASHSAPTAAPAPNFEPSKEVLDVIPTNLLG